jgi:hypothetical protein
MNNMDQETYIKDRLEDQITWYGDKSKRNKKWFKALSIIEVIAATTIPFLAGYINDKTPALNVIIGLLGVIIAIISGLISLNRFQELWIQYRTTCESLKHHKYLYISESKPYHGEDAFQLLVENVEALVSKENTKWGEFIISVKDKAKEKNG